MSVDLGVSRRFSMAVVLAVSALVAVGLCGGVPVAVPVAGAVGVCPNEGYRVGPSAELPDCRAYEMVSPPDKNGGEVDGGVDKDRITLPMEQAAADGEAVTYASTSSFVETDPASAVVASQYLSQRTPGGWRTSEAGPVQELPGGRAEIGSSEPGDSLYQGFSENLEYGFLLAYDPQPDPLAPAGYYNPYLFDAATGSYQLLSGGVTPPSWEPYRHLSFNVSNPGFVVAYAGVSEDGQHVIFEATDALTPGAIPGRDNLYEWNAGRGVELVSVLPEGAVDTSGGEVALGGALTFGATQSDEPPNDGGALSSSGLRAFWTGGNSPGGQLYMHEILGAGARTVDVSASQRSGQPNGGGTYWAANREGSLVYFTSPLQLTEASTATGGGEDLYRYDVSTGALSDLSVDGDPGETAAVQGVLGQGESEGVPYVYFVAHGVLAEGARAGANNLYVVRGDGQPVLVATLGSFDGGKADVHAGGEVSDFTGAVKWRTSRVSPDGQLLAFQSVMPLTGYDNMPAGGKPCLEPAKNRLGGFGEGNGSVDEDPPEGRCMEVFEYDVQTGRLTCVSCVSGVPPTTDSLVPESPHLWVNTTGWESSTVQQRYLLDDGRLYFESEDPLLAQATNGRMNVYEYEPDGVGQCSAAGSGGCLYLISTGEASGESYFADASSSGRDVFFTTNQQLVPQDGDEATDMYDAREDGGFASATPPPCSGEACKPALAPAPAIYGAPASAAFQGAGNITQPAGKTGSKSTKVKRKKRKPSKRRAKRARTGRRGRGARGSVVMGVERVGGR